MNTMAMQLLERLARHATDAGERIAVREIESRRHLTFSSLHRRVEQFAATLSPAMPAGSVVKLQCRGACNFHIAFLGALAAKMTVFPIACATVPAELDALAAKASAAAIIDGELSIARLASSPPHSEGPALYLQSSGTTGLPKIVRRNAASLDAVCAQMVEAIAIGPADGVLSCVPLSHSYGLEHGLLITTWAGATAHIADGFDLELVRRELGTPAITVFPSVPSVYEMLANLHEPGRRFAALRVAYSAGGPLPASIFGRLRERAAITVSQLYGATELGSITFSNPTDANFAPASVGRPMRDVELRIDDDQQLLVRAASMMSAYVDDEDMLTPDGFFPTGDLAKLDAHGNLFIIGRLKFLIDIGGLKVNPMEVEQAIIEHPGVDACVVVPMRLSETVSRLKAVVTPASPAHPPTIESLREFARKRLSPHKVPRLFEVRPMLPRSATGKILRHLLVESA